MKLIISLCLIAALFILVTLSLFRGDINISDQMYDEMNVSISNWYYKTTVGGSSPSADMPEFARARELRDQLVGSGYLKKVSLDMEQLQAVVNNDELSKKIESEVSIIAFQFLLREPSLLESQKLGPVSFFLTDELDALIKDGGKLK